MTDKHHQPLPTLEEMLQQQAALEQVTNPDPLGLDDADGDNDQPASCGWFLVYCLGQLKNAVWRRQTLGYVLLLVLVEMLALHLSWPWFLQPIYVGTLLLDLAVNSAWGMGDGLGWFFQRLAAFLDPYAGLVLGRVGYYFITPVLSVQAFAQALLQRFEQHERLRLFVTPAALAMLGSFLLVTGVIGILVFTLVYSCRKRVAAAAAAATTVSSTTPGPETKKSQ